MTKTRTENGEASPALIVVGVLILVVLLIAGGFAIRWVVAPFEGKTQQREKTVGDGDYRIASYDHFFDLCGSIQAIEDQIQITEDRKVDPDAGFSAGQKGAILQALKNTRATAIRQYNADAAKAGTQGQFKASELPYNIDITQENTTCAR